MLLTGTRRSARHGLTRGSFGADQIRPDGLAPMPADAVAASPSARAANFCVRPRRPPHPRRPSRRRVCASGCRGVPLAEHLRRPGKRCCDRVGRTDRRRHAARRRNAHGARRLVCPRRCLAAGGGGLCPARDQGLHVSAEAGQGHPEFAGRASFGRCRRAGLGAGRRRPAAGARRAQSAGQPMAVSRRRRLPRLVSPTGRHRCGATAHACCSTMAAAGSGCG